MLAAPEKAGKRGWAFGGWFGGSGSGSGAKKDSVEPKATRANLGEASSFVYDPELKRWVNKKAGAEAPEAKKSAPPPPKSVPHSLSGTAPPLSALRVPPPAGDGGRASAPPGGSSRRFSPSPSVLSSLQSLDAPPPQVWRVSNTMYTGPPIVP